MKQREINGHLTDDEESAQRRKLVGEVAELS